MLHDMMEDVVLPRGLNVRIKVKVTKSKSFEISERILQGLNLILFSILLELCNIALLLISLPFFKTTL